MPSWRDDARYRSYITRLIHARLAWDTSTRRERADAAEMAASAGLRVEPALTTEKAVVSEPAEEEATRKPPKR